MGIGPINYRYAVLWFNFVPEVLNVFLAAGQINQFLKKNNTLTTSPIPWPIRNPIDPLTLTLTLSLDLTPQFIILHSPGFELQTSDFEVNL